MTLFAMQATRLDGARLPPFSNQRGCARCGRRYEIRVHFDRDCALVLGDHFHRLCPCGHQWLERAAAAVQQEEVRPYR